MFGFLRPAAPSKSYRQAYARCCSVQHARYGVTSLPVLSFEGVFLYLCAVDAGLCPGPPEQMPTCCRLRTYRRYQRHGDAAVVGFCASLGLLLAAIKLEDDIADDRSWPARLARAWLRRPMQEAEAYFAAIDPEFRTRIDDLLAAHHQLEANAEAPELEVYVGPTADAFAYVFGLLGRQMGSQGEVLSAIGRQVGAAIIAFDAAFDWSRDRRRGSYNPLPDRSAVHQAYNTCLRHLSDAGWSCIDNWQCGSQAAEVLRGVFDRVAGRARLPDSAHSTPRRGKWFSTMPKTALARAGFCDCDCGGCDCPCDGPGGCDHAGCLPADVCCCACDPCPGACHRNAEKTTTAKAGESPESTPPSPASKLVGMTGKTTSALNPTGLVEIAGQRLPGRSEGEWIASGVEVLVIEENKFGVTVRPK